MTNRPRLTGIFRVSSNGVTNMMKSRIVRDWLPVLYAGVVLYLVAVMSGCAVSAQLMTDAQHRRRTQDRVLIDRSHGSYKGDNATTLDEYRARYRLANDPQNGS